MEERKIIFSKRFKKYKFMNSDTESKDDADYDAAISQVSDFFEYMRKNRKSVPDEERIANKDKFIKTVEELSNAYKIDVDLEEFSEGYVARQPIKFCVNNNPSSNNKTADCGVIRLSDLPRVNFSFLSAECYARFA